MTLNVGLNVAENGQIYTKREFKPTIPHKYINFLDNSNAAIPRKYIKLSTSNAMQQSDSLKIEKKKTIQINCVIADYGS